MFNHMLADDFVELVVGKGIGDNRQIVDHIGGSFRVVIEADGIRVLVQPTAHIEYSLAFKLCQ